MPRRRRLPSSSGFDGSHLQVAPRPSEVSCTPRPGSVPTTMAEIGRTQRARAAWSQAGSERVRTRRERQLGGSPGADDLVRRCALTDLLGEFMPVSYTHLRAHETDSYLVCRLLLEKKKKKKNLTNTK